ncbi:para-nitrobenzyl esterase [Dactylonectria estremocensis]|uniref:Carboxylic ester hydrolase n=1 Tax=Dactylonectria estremocensis TaxID=1079267 RepID=A0A9P9ELY8_9HYPO|nr:para-nitrobenzyl esterase [Dactylonectria estremocensis]
MAPTVQLPTWEAHSHLQTVVGKPSPVSPDLEEFRGIPYGTVNERWTHSLLRTRLPDDVFDATKNGPKCPQPSGPNNSRTFQSYLPFPDDIESEFDCLNLFTIRPSDDALRRRGFDPATSRLPVLVYIHGGGLAFGAATDPMWDPSRFVMRSLERGSPIITVSINYRLNFFGFAASTDILRSQNPTSLRGVNFGFRDQKVALEWVSRNIGAFGGDPGRVSIGGQSAGSLSVNIHLLEAEAKPETPLFRRAIMQSGAIGILGPIPMEEADKTWAALCKTCNVDSETSGQDRLDLIRKLPATALIEAAGKLRLGRFLAVLDNFTMFEDDASNGGTVIDLGPVDITNRPSRSSSVHTDVLMGFNDAEMSFIKGLPSKWDIIKPIFTRTYADPVLRSKILHAYGFNDSSSENDTLQSLHRFLNESTFELSVSLARTSLRNRRRVEGRPEGKTVHSFHVEFGNPFPGPGQGISHHCVELIYLFEAFHDALALADQGILKPYQDPSDSVANEKSEPTSTASDSGNKVQTEKEETTGSNRTHLALAQAIQDHWLDFIVPDKVAIGGAIDEITVFGKDLSTRVESLDGPAWQARQERWGLLAKDIPAMNQTRDSIMALHSF